MSRSAPLDIMPGDTVTVGGKHKHWSVTDMQPHGPLGQVEASLRDGVGGTKTHVPVHELFLIRREIE
jgi:hypothetical protein